MTAAEMKSLFLVLYDKITNLAAPGYEDSEIEQLLNKAQLQFIKSRYNPKGNRYNEGVEQTEKRRKDLSELTVSKTLGNSDLSADQTGTHPNGYLFNIPSNLLYTLEEEATIASSDSCINGTRISVIPITHDQYTANIRNPFKKPDATVIWRLDLSRDTTVAQTTKRHELVCASTYTISSYHIVYLKFPRDISITNNISCELDTSVHEEIVDIAVRIATAVTNPQEYQIKSAEQSLTE